MVEGISHLTYIVQDLEAATAFFESIFEGKVVYASGEARYSLSEERFLQIGQLWVCIMKGDALSQRTYNHTAFKIPHREFDAYRRRVEAMGVEILPGRPRVEGEGQSLYFYDFDNHLFELHTGTLAKRLAAYKP